MKLTTMGRDTPTLKLRRRAKSKVDYGRDRDLDVEGENKSQTLTTCILLLYCSDHLLSGFKKIDDFKGINFRGIKFCDFEIFWRSREIAFTVP